MFRDLCFLIIRLDEFQLDKEVDRLQLSIENTGGKTYVKWAHDNDVNYLQKYPIDNIISKTTDFIEYDMAISASIPVVTPEWIFNSLQMGKVLPATKFNPDGRFFLRSCFVCIGDDIPTCDKEIIYGGVKAFGGMYLDMLTSFTTHLITSDFNSDKSIIARSSDLNIKIVSPHWIDDCLKMGRFLNEKAYSLDKETQEDLNQVLVDEDNDVDGMLKFDTKFFDGKKFYISGDYNLSKNLKNSINALILKNGGKIATKFDQNVDIYLGKYRHGSEFKSSYKNNRIIVGNLQWLYAVILNNRWTLPIQSLLLHYPIPIKPLTGFKNLKISVTNYGQNGRYYLTRLITILGGTFTKNLTKENDFLIVGKPTGNKYLAAHEKWLTDGKPMVKVVNHVWLEECFANWEMLDPTNPKYTHLGYTSTGGLTRMIGGTKLNPKVLDNWIDFDVDDSMEEDLLKLGQETDYSSEEEEDQDRDQDRVEAEKEQDDVAHDVSNMEDQQVPVDKGDISKEPSQPSPLDKEAAQSLNDSPASSQSQQNALPRKHVETAKQTPSKSLEPSTYTTPLKGRNAKVKAALKLHDNMEDLIKHQQLLKSSKKMDHYMEELENTPNKRSRSQDKENITPPSKKSKASPAPSKKDDAKIANYNITAIMTGCEADVRLSRDDTSKLKDCGVKIVASPVKVNCLIAPKILRTEKFLTSLGKVDYIIHPSFLNDLMDSLARDEESLPEIENYRLDKIILVKEVNNQLGYSDEDQVNGIENIINSPKGELFKDYSLNLTSNLNGGYDVLSKILTSHGVRALKLVPKTVSNLSSLLDTDGKVIVLVHKSKDSKLIGKLTDCTLVEWDWCVKSIFKQQIEELDEYVLG